MSVCFSEGLSSALEIVKNLSDKEDISYTQKRAYQMAMSLLILANRIFDTKSKKESLKIVSAWRIINDEISNFYLAERPDKSYCLYAQYIGLNNILGLPVKDEELECLAYLNESEILKYWKKLFNNDL